MVGRGWQAGVSHGAVLVAVALCVVVPLLDGGGVTERARALFVALAGIAVAIVLVLVDRTAARALRAPAVLVLLAIAALSALSAVWTIGDPDDALLWSTVIAGYAAVALAAYTVAATRTGIWQLALVLAAIAVAEGMTGIVGAAIRDQPLALRLERSWRPGGTIEYPPALAYLQVCAIPLLLKLMTTARAAWTADVAAAAVAVCAVVLALAESRTAIAAACLLAGVAIVWNRQTLGGSRSGAVAAVAVMIAAAIAGEVLLGGPSEPNPAGGDGPRLAAALAILLASAGLWHGARALLPMSPSPARKAPRSGRRRLVLAAGAVAVLIVAAGAGLSVTERRTGPGVAERVDLLHDRGDMWTAAANVAVERPVAGAGADAFADATSGEPGALGIRYAHSLLAEMAVELGLLGVLLVIALYAVAIVAAWKARKTAAAWLLAPTVLVFLLSNLVDWTWHLAGIGAFAAAALGGLAAAVPSGSRRRALTDPRQTSDRRPIPTGRTLRSDRERDGPPG